MVAAATATRASEVADFGEEVFEVPQCVHCGTSVSDYYMVVDRLWCLATTEGSERDGQMHWECLKLRLAPLGHKLSAESLNDAPVNKWFREEQGWVEGSCES